MTQNEAYDIAIALIDLRDSAENRKPKGIANSGNCGSDSGVFVQRILARFPKVRDAVDEIDILRA